MRALLSLLLLAGFGGGFFCDLFCHLARAEDAPRAVQVPLPRARPPAVKPPPWVATEWHEPRTFREAAGPDFKSDEVTAEPSACRLRLQKFAAVEAMPRLIGPGACGGGDLVRLDQVTIAGGKPVEITPAPYLRCPMAEQLALWVRDDAAPQVANAGATLTRVNTYDDFDCRGRNRQRTGKVSEHGKANAVDVRGLTFGDGRFAKLTDIHVDKPLRLSLRKSACARFTTVLGPGSDGYHEEHIHLDLAERHNGYRICQWDVREPPPPPKPVEPKIAETSSQPELPKSSEQVPAEPSDATPSETPQVQLANIEIPLPRPRPPVTSHHRRKSRGGIHFPFNLLR
jgi:hypothetical protein